MSQRGLNDSKNDQARKWIGCLIFLTECSIFSCLEVPAGMEMLMYIQLGMITHAFSPNKAHCFAQSGDLQQKNLERNLLYDALHLIIMSEGGMS